MQEVTIKLCGSHTHHEGRRGPVGKRLMEDDMVKYITYMNEIIKEKIKTINL